MSTALIDACNEALALCQKGGIVDLDEASIEAREANRFQKTLLEEMPEWTEWPELVTRKALAQTTNDRPAEWLYAYQAPDDLADPIAIRMVQDALTRGPLAGPQTMPYQDALPLRYLHEGGKIYTNVETPTLVYAKSTMAVSDMTALTKRAFIVNLAARCAVPLKAPSKLSEKLEKSALVAKLEAIADAQNRSPKQMPHYVSEAELAREGHLE